MLKFDGSAILSSLATEPTQWKASLEPSEEGLIFEPVPKTRFDTEDSVSLFVQWLMKLIERLTEQVSVVKQPLLIMPTESSMDSS